MCDFLSIFIFSNDGWSYMLTFDTVSKETSSHTHKPTEQNMYSVKNKTE